MSHKHKKLLCNRKSSRLPQEIKDWADDLIANGLPPTIFVRENPDGSPCFELKTRIVAVRKWAQ